MAKILRGIAMAVAWGIGIVLMLVVAGGVVLPRLVGWDVYVVTSGSMEPAISVGSVVAVKPVSTDALGVGDVVTYRLNGSTEVVTHRVVEWRGTGSDRLFTTRGDANDSSDPARVPAAAVVGQVQFGVAYVGYVLGLVATPAGAGVAAALAAVALLAGNSGKANVRRPDTTRHRRRSANSKEVIHEREPQQA